MWHIAPINNDTKLTFYVTNLCLTSFLTEKETKKWPKLNQTLIFGKYRGGWQGGEKSDKKTGNLPEESSSAFARAVDGRSTFSTFGSGLGCLAVWGRCWCCTPVARAVDVVLLDVVIVFSDDVEIEFVFVNGLLNVGVCGTEVGVWGTADDGVAGGTLLSGEGDADANSDSFNDIKDSERCSRSSKYSF